MQCVLCRRPALTKQVVCKVLWTQVEATWQLMAWKMAQAGSRASKTGRYLQWRGSRPEQGVMTPGLQNLHGPTFLNSAIFGTARCTCFIFGWLRLSEPGKPTMQLHLAAHPRRNSVIRNCCSLGRRNNKNVKPCRRSRRRSSGLFMFLALGGGKGTRSWPKRPRSHATATLGVGRRVASSVLVDVNVDRSVALRHRAQSTSGGSLGYSRSGQ